jgi:hypothetical protein
MPALTPASRSPSNETCSPGSTRLSTGYMGMLHSPNGPPAARSCPVSSPRRTRSSRSRGAHTSDWTRSSQYRPGKPGIVPGRFQQTSHATESGPVHQPSPWSAITTAEPIGSHVAPRRRGHATSVPDRRARRTRLRSLPVTPTSPTCTHTGPAHAQDRLSTFGAACPWPPDQADLCPSSDSGPGSWGASRRWGTWAARGRVRSGGRLAEPRSR